MKTQKGDEIIAVADRYIDKEGYYERSLQGKILVDEAELREILRKRLDFDDPLTNSEEALIRKILGE